MSLIEKLCKELGVEMGEEWKGNLGDTYKITKDGLFYEWTIDEWAECGINDYKQLLTGELKPVWQPKLGTTYYIPDIFAAGLCITERWDNLDKDYMYLKRGLAFETKEEAIEMAYKIIDFVKEERENE